MRTMIMIAFFAVMVLASVMPTAAQDPSNGTIPPPGGAAYLPWIANDVPFTAPPAATDTPTSTPTTIPTVTPIPTASPTPLPQPIPVGESITCHGMQVVAEFSEIRDSLGGSPAPQGGKFLIVIARVTNVGYKTDDIGSYDIAAKDSQGREFDMAELDAQWAAQDLYGHDGVYTDIAPSLSQTLVFVWLIAPDSTNLRFVPNTLCDY